MSSIADIIVSSAWGEPKLIVEVKNKYGADSDWAARLKASVDEHSPLPATSYFLLATPEKFFLWREGSTPADNRADYEIDSGPIIARYLSSPPTSVYPLELAVLSWVGDILRQARAQGAPDAASWLVQSGLLSAIKGGQVLAQSTR
jgi:hypothetical protein